MENIQRINIDVVNHKVYEYIYSKQWDEGREIIFNITDDNEAVDPGNYVMFQMKKPDGHVVMYSCPIVARQAKVTLSRQMTAVAGKIPYQLGIYSNAQPTPDPDDPVDPAVYEGNLVTTVTGFMIVEPSVIQPSDVESSDEFNIVTNTAEALARVAEVLANDGEAIIQAGRDSIEYAKRAKSYAVGGTDYERADWETLTSTETEGYAVNSNTGEVVALENAAYTIIDLTGHPEYIALNFRTTAFNDHYGYGFVLDDDSWSGVATMYNEEATVDIPLGAKAFKVSWDTTKLDAQVISATTAFEDDDYDNAKYYYDETKQVYNICFVGTGLMLYSDQWDEEEQTQTLRVDNIIADESLQFITVRPRSESAIEYNDCGVTLLEQGEGTLTFHCNQIPENDLEIFIMTQTSNSYGDMLTSNILYYPTEPSASYIKRNDYWCVSYE